jgi:hypothetical protein
MDDQIAAAAVAEGRRDADIVDLRIGRKGFWKDFGPAEGSR